MFFLHVCTFAFFLFFLIDNKIDRDDTPTPSLDPHVSSYLYYYFLFQCLTSAVNQDAHLAIAFYQRGVLYLKNQQYVITFPGLLQNK